MLLLLVYCCLITSVTREWQIKSNRWTFKKKYAEKNPSVIEPRAETQQSPPRHPWKTTEEEKKTKKIRVQCWTEIPVKFTVQLAAQPESPAAENNHHFKTPFFFLLSYWPRVFQRRYQRRVTSVRSSWVAQRESSAQNNRPEQGTRKGAKRSPVWKQWWRCLVTSVENKM